MANPANLNAATSLEQQLYLCALNLQMKELALPADTRPDNVQINHSADGDNVTISITFATTPAIENGKATYAVITYLDD